MITTATSLRRDMLSFVEMKNGYLISLPIHADQHRNVYFSLHLSHTFFCCCVCCLDPVGFPLPCQFVVPRLACHAFIAWQMMKMNAKFRNNGGFGRTHRQRKETKRRSEEGISYHIFFSYLICKMTNEQFISGRHQEHNKFVRLISAGAAAGVRGARSAKKQSSPLIYFQLCVVCLFLFSLNLSFSSA